MAATLAAAFVRFFVVVIQLEVVWVGAIIFKLRSRILRFGCSTTLILHSESDLLRNFLMDISFVEAVTLKLDRGSGLLTFNLLRLLLRVGLRWWLFVVLVLQT